MKNYEDLRRIIFLFNYDKYESFIFNLNFKLYKKFISDFDNNFKRYFYVNVSDID